MHAIVDLGSLPEWLAATGTVGATVTAIWIALRSESERLIVGFSLDPRSLEIHVVNASNRPILIQDIELELGRWKPNPEGGLEIVLTQQAQVPARIDARQDKTFAVSISIEPSYLPDRVNKAWRNRSRLDRSLFAVVTTGERRRLRCRLPRAVLKELLERAPLTRS